MNRYNVLPYLFFGFSTYDTNTQRKKLFCHKSYVFGCFSVISFILVFLMWTMCAIACLKCAMPQIAAGVNKNCHIMHRFIFNSKREFWVFGTHFITIRMVTVLIILCTNNGNSQTLSLWTVEKRNYVCKLMAVSSLLLLMKSLVLLFNESTQVDSALHLRNKNIL